MQKRELKQQLIFLNKMTKKEDQQKRKKPKKSEERVEKVIVFDASTLISLSMNGLYPELKKLREDFDGKFIITKDVWHEIIEKPLGIKKFELEALKAKALLEEGVLELPNSVGITQKQLSKKTNTLLKKANNIYKQKNKKSVEIIHKGEASAIALIRELEKKGISCLLAIDERTTRMLIEKPKELQNYLKRKLHTNLKLDKSNFKPFRNIKVIRSSELVYIAFKKDLVRLKDGERVLDALLYGVKFKGCAISSDEIKKIKKI